MTNAATFLTASAAEAEVQEDGGGIWRGWAEGAERVSELKFEEKTTEEDTAGKAKGPVNGGGGGARRGRGRGRGGGRGRGRGR